MLKKTGFATGAVAAGLPGRHGLATLDGTDVPHKFDGTQMLCGTRVTALGAQDRRSPGIGVPPSPDARTAGGKFSRPCATSGVLGVQDRRSPGIGVPALSPGFRTTAGKAPHTCPASDRAQHH